MAKHLTRRQKKELVEELSELQSELCEKVNRIAQIAKALDDQNAMHYIVAPLQIAADAEHGWLTRDGNMTEWIERLNEELDEGAEDDDADEEI